MAMFTIMYASIVQGPVTDAGKRKVTVIDWSRRFLVCSIAYRMDDRISILRRGKLIINLFQCGSCRHIGEWRCSRTHS